MVWLQRYMTSRYSWLGGQAGSSMPWMGQTSMGARYATKGSAATVRRCGGKVMLE